MEKIGLVINELDRVKICCHDQTSSGFWFEISASLRLLPQHFEYKDYQIVYNIPRLYVCLSADMKSLKKAKFYQIARILDLKKHIKRRNQEISEADIIAFLAHQYIYVLKLGSLDSFKDKFMKIAEEKWQEIEKEIKTSKK